MANVPHIHSPPDSLDAWEARALEALSSGSEDALKAIEADLALDDQGNVLLPTPPPIDPSEGRRSLVELRFLLRTVRGTPEAVPGRTRAGYTLRSRTGKGTEGDQTEVLPAFAAALGGHALRTSFSDLWSVDAALWDRLESGDAWELARLWLESPGRRLVQDIKVLATAPRPKPLGATDLSLERLYAAAGVDRQPAENAALIAWLKATPPHRARWRERSAALPGWCLHAWEPRDGSVTRAMYLLEQGQPVGLRGAALAWLLDRAARAPFYEADGLRRDLREDLSARLATALPLWLGDDVNAAVAREVEALALQHAARLTAGAPRPEAALRGWGLARWILSCLRRSPFYGGDEEVTAAHLRALLPATPLPLPDDADALDPARFDGDGDGLDPAEIALLGGLLAHYRQGGWEEPGKVLLPTPLPLVHALQRMARRPVRAAEEEAEAALAAGRNALGWPAAHVAPPITARWLMTELRIAWIEQAGEEAQLDAIERLAREPGRYEWTAWAILREGEKLSPTARARAVAVLRGFLRGQAGLSGQAAGAMAAGLLRELSEEEARAAAERASTAEEAWRPFVLDALAGAAEGLPRGAPVWSDSIARLMDLATDTRLDTKTRLNAALFALRRASGSRMPEREEALERLAQVAGGPPFSEHAGLRRELRRLGVSAAAGGKR